MNRAGARANIKNLQLYKAINQGYFHSVNQSALVYSQWAGCRNSQSTRNCPGWNQWLLSWHIIYLPLRYCRICEFQYTVRVHPSVFNKTIPRSRSARINFFPPSRSLRANLHNNIAFHRYHRSGSARRARVQNMIATLIRITKADFRAVSSPTRGVLLHFRHSHRRELVQNHRWNLPKRQADNLLFLDSGNI